MEATKTERDLEQALAEAREEYHKAQKKVSTIYKKLEAEKDARILKEISLLDTEEEKIKYFITTTEMDSMVLHQEASKFFYSLGISTHGVSSELMQRVISIVVSHADDIHKKADVIHRILPHVGLGKDGAKYFDVMENTCSEFGSYGVRYYPATGSWNLDKITYGRQTNITETTNLVDLLAYIQKNHPYC